MPRLNLSKPSHVMITWAVLTVASASFYTVTKNDIYLRRRVQAVPSETIPTKTGLSWEERIALDEENAAKKGYRVNYKDIRDSTAAVTSSTSSSD
ncbi:hypothetical protein EMPS_06917 [Entomortierella parvispora]|uniref:Uncharacterized protein n=1 Tax=Entomortierella parvispora TaxID=205924 RepID=A0A9P3LXV8_9FUNG|nr:hypothetical protein EMPS_06917 [Entomortierella parvispora]